MKTSALNNNLTLGGAGKDNMTLNWKRKIKKTISALVVAFLLGGVFCGGAFGGNEEFARIINECLSLVATSGDGIHYISSDDSQHTLSLLDDAFKVLDADQPCPEGFSGTLFRFAIEMRGLHDHHNKHNPSQHNIDCL